MRRLFFALGLLLAASAPAQAAFVHVQTVTETTNQFSGDANSAATVSATTIGNTIVVVIISNQNRSFSSASCGVGGGFTSIHRQGTTAFVQILAGVATASVTSCSITLDGNSDGTLADSLTVMEFSGGAAAVTESGTSTGVENLSTTNTHTATDVTPATSETLFIGAAVYGGSTGGLTQDADFTLAFSGTAVNHRYIGYRIQSGSTTAQNFTSSTVTARTSRVALGALQGAAAGGGGGSPKNVPLLGVGD